MQETPESFLQPLSFQDDPLSFIESFLQLIKERMELQENINNMMGSVPQAELTAYLNELPSRAPDVFRAEIGHNSDYNLGVVNAKTPIEVSYTEDKEEFTEILLEQLRSRKQLIESTYEMLKSLSVGEFGAFEKEVKAMTKPDRSLADLSTNTSSEEHLHVNLLNQLNAVKELYPIVEDSWRS